MPLVLIETRFWAKVEKTDTCWLWTGYTRNGYGQIGRGRAVDGLATVHRLVLELQGVAIPAGYEVDHLCRVRACVNPDHLEAVTKAENRRRQALAQPRRLSCYRGHPFTPENLRHYYRTGRGGLAERQCRICLNAGTRARRRALA